MQIDQISDDKNMFFNSQHLNSKGATLFSYDLAKFIKRNYNLKKFIKRN